MKKNKNSDWLSDVMDVVLEDDDTPYGGIMFSGETVWDFINSVDEDIANDITSLEKFNEILIANGIKPIKRRQSA